MPRKPAKGKARKRAGWSYSHGDRGERVRIYEPKPGQVLRLDYRDAYGVRQRPEAGFRLRTSPDAEPDPKAIAAAQELVRKKVHELALGTINRSVEATTLTVSQAFALMHDPKRQALPASASGRRHHTDARTFWEAELGASRLWNAIVPADVEGALKRLVAEGKVPTAQKRLQMLRALYRWLHQKMRLRGLEDPTLGLDGADLVVGYTPRRTRLDRAQLLKLRDAIARAKPRTRLFLRILSSNVTRGGQVRNLMRSGVDAKLEPPPAEGIGPHGWIVAAPVKGQAGQVLFLTRQARAELDAALAAGGYLAALEAQYSADELDDYPLFPGGRAGVDADLRLAPISDHGMRDELNEVFKAAGIIRKPGDWIGFHTIRRSVADVIEQEEGLDTLQAAGGWTRRETIEGHGYTERAKRERVERARKVFEGLEGTE